MNEYRDGDVVNGHRFDAATNTWIPIADPYQWSTMSPLPTAKPWYRKPGWIAAMILGFFFIVVPIVSAVVATNAETTQAAAPAAPAPAPAPAVPAPAPPAPEPVAPAPPPPAPEPDVSDLTDNEDLVELLLEETWDMQSAEDQATICLAWSLGDEEELLDSFQDGAGDANFSREQVRAFFDRKCG